jgi:hypothetical protein
MTSSLAVKSLNNKLFPSGAAIAAKKEIVNAILLKTVGELDPSS